MEHEGYLIPAKASCATLVEKKSEFIAHLSPVDTEDKALAFLETIRAKHRTASHNVYAYVLRESARARYSDDGEPAKTAGLPVLSAIQHAGLFNCCVVVTRYFGGTKLGTGGLVRAYSAAATAAIQTAGSAIIRPVCRIGLHLPYPLYEQATRILEAAGAQAEDAPVFAESVTMNWLIPAEAAPALCKSLQELMRGEEGIAQSEPFDACW